MPGQPSDPVASYRHPGETKSPKIFSIAQAQYCDTGGCIGNSIASYCAPLLIGLPGEQLFHQGCIFSNATGIDAPSHAKCCDTAEDRNLPILISPQCTCIRMSLDRVQVIAGYIMVTMLDGTSVCRAMERVPGTADVDFVHATAHKNSGYPVKRMMMGMLLALRNCVKM